MYCYAEHRPSRFYSYSFQSLENQMRGRRDTWWKKVRLYYLCGLLLIFGFTVGLEASQKIFTFLKYKAPFLIQGCFCNNENVRIYRVNLRYNMCLDWSQKYVEVYPNRVREICYIGREFHCTLDHMFSSVLLVWTQPGQLNTENHSIVLYILAWNKSSCCTRI